MQAMMDEGKLPKDFMDRHFDAVDANVFGVDAPKDRILPARTRSESAPRVSSISVFGSGR